MELLLVLVSLIGIGPLALLLGVDSREDDARGWWPGAPDRRRPGPRELAPRRLEATSANCGGPPDQRFGDPGHRAEQRPKTLADMESMP